MPCLEEIIIENEVEIQKKFSEFKKKIQLAGLILEVLIFLRFLGIKIIENELQDRNGKKCQWPKCKECGARLRNKENKKRSIISLLGKIEWKRKVGRCPNGCQIGQYAPLDERLGLVKNQRSSNELRYAGCILAIFVPYGISSFLLKALTGIDVCPKTIWNWCQVFGKKAEEKIKLEILLLNSTIRLQVEKISEKILNLPLIIGADGVFVPMRPKEKSPKGKVEWKEVKVGIFARLKACVTKDGEKKSRIVHKRLVAVRTKKKQFRDMMKLEAHKQQVKETKIVAWISDGGKGFWSLFCDSFSFTIGIIDFYHVSQYLWKFAKEWLDGRTNKASKWYHSARHLLRHGDITSIGASIDTKQILQLDPKSELRKCYHNMTSYLFDHMDHTNYDHFKSLGLPIGSGMVESACKWLVQQRFKGTGMRWSEEGFDNLLSLRVAWVNNRFDSLFF